MKPFPLAQLDTCADGQCLAMIAGTLIALYPRKSGTTKQDKPWSIQNATLRASDGTEIGLFIKDREELAESTWKNRPVVITSKEGKTLSGIYVMDDEYNGTITRKLKITGSAELAFATDDAPTAATHEPADQDGHVDPSTLPWDHPDHPDNKPKAQAPAPAQAAPPTTAQAKTSHRSAPGSDELREARKTVLQIANLHLVCQLAVDRYEAPTFKKMTGHDMSEPQRQAAVASIFIKADREGLVRFMPASDLSSHPDFA